MLSRGWAGWLGAAAALLLAAGCSKPEPFCVVTYNIHGGKGIDQRRDLARLAAVIKAQNARFVGLQEVFRNAPAAEGVDQAAELGRLTGLKASFGRAIDVKGGGEYGNVILSREEPLAVRTVPLPGAEMRALLIAEFEDCYFATAHFCCEEDNTNRLASAAILARELGSLSKPVIISGDWNADQCSRTLEAIQKSFTVVSPMGDGTVTFHGYDIGFCLDYVAIDNAHLADVKVLKAEVVEERNASDHAPVRVELVWQ